MVAQSVLEDSVIFFFFVFYNLSQIIGLSIILYAAFYGKYLLFYFFLLMGLWIWRTFPLLCETSQAERDEHYLLNNKCSKRRFGVDPNWVEILNFNLINLIKRVNFFNLNLLILYWVSVRLSKKLCAIMSRDKFESHQGMLIKLYMSTLIRPI